MATKNMVALLVLALLAVAVSGQDLGEFTPAPAPAPTMGSGDGVSLGMSGALMCSSLFLSMLALLKD